MGYLTNDDQWLRLARSNRVRTPGVETTTDTVIPEVTPEVTPDAGLVGGVLGAGGAAALIPFLTSFGSHITLKPRDNHTIDAEWEVPDTAKAAAIENGGRYPQLRICDVTDIDDLDRQPPHSIQKYDWDESTQQQQFPNLESERTYLVEIGYATNDDQWLRLARSNRVRTPGVETTPDTVTPEVTPDVGLVGGMLGAGGAAALIPFLTTFGSHITLKLRDNHTADAEFVVPDTAKAAAIENGGRYPQLRICDVTDIDDLDRQPPHSVQKYDWDESTQQQQFPNLESDRIYLVEIGYVTSDDQWLRLARSNRVRTPGVETTTDTVTPKVTPEVTPDVGLVGEVLGAGGAAALIPFLTTFGSHITLWLINDHTADSEWEVPDSAKAAAIENGGRYPQLRICDVTDIDDLDAQPPHSIQKYDWDESSQQQQFPNLESHRIYLVEIGYATEDDQWLRLARSNRVCTPGVETTTDTVTPKVQPDAAIVPGLAGVGGLAAALIPYLTAFGSHITLKHRDNHTADAEWEVPTNAKSAAIEHGGQYPQLRICDVTDIDNLDRHPPHSLQKYDWDEFTQHQQFHNLKSDHTYLVEIGYLTEENQWLRLARSNRVRMPGVETTPDAVTPEAGVVLGLGAGGATLIPVLTDLGSQITLTLRDNQTADARWHIPDAAQTAARVRGGQQMQLRIYDVTDVDNLETHSPNRVRRYDCEESIQERRVPIIDSSCEYLAEIGYISDEGQWFMLARSNRVRINTGAQGLHPATDTDTPSPIEEVATLPPLSSFPSHMILIPTGEGTVDVRWDISDEAKDVAKQRGGRQLQLRVYDVTNINGDEPGTTIVEQCDFDESTFDCQLELAGERDYLTEVGYVTDDSEWLSLGRSNSVRVPADSTRDEDATPRNLGLMGAGLMGAGGVAGSIPRRGSQTTSSVTLIPCDNEAANVYWEVPDAAAEDAQQRGGRQFQLYIYDVTDIPADSVATNSVQQFDFDVSLPHPELLHLEGNHDYFAEIGYLTDDGEWLMLARSYQVRIPTATTITPLEFTGKPNLDISIPDPGVVPTLDVNRCRVALIPCDNQAANVYWEVPDAAAEDAQQRGGRQFQLHLYDVTGVPADSMATNSVQQFDFNVSLPHPELLHLEGNHDYFAEIGYLTAEVEWLVLARSYRVRIPALTTPDLSDVELMPGVMVLPSLSSIPCRIVLTPGVEGTLDVEWEVPDEAKEVAKQHGADQFLLRAYDVTNTSVEVPASALIEECPIAESISSWQFEFESQREYLVEIGYLTEEGLWLLLARSNRLYVPVEETTDEEEVGSTAVAFTGVDAAEQPLSALSSTLSYITLSLGENELVDARWEVPEGAKAEAKQQGGQKFQLHVYEVTGIDFDTQSAHGVQRYNCNELIKQWQVPNLNINCEYIIEIGYVTDTDDWLLLARSNRIRVPATSGMISDVTGVSPQVAIAACITLTLSDSQSIDAHWELPRAARVAAQAQGGQKFQLRIYEVTGVDLETPLLQNLRRYNCHELIQQLQIPNLEADCDYLAEIGYVTDDEQWLMLARSNSVRISGSALIDQTTLGTTGATISTVSESVRQGSIPTVMTTPQAVRTGNCAIQHLTVHSRHNCHLLDDQRMKQLQDTAVSHPLEPGIYVVRIKSGAFGYGSELFPTGEPMVVFWIYGGTVINKKTRVPVGATWSTLNGYHDSLTLEVRETSTLCAFFFDSYLEDNQGEVTISVVRLYDAD